MKNHPPIRKYFWILILVVFATLRATSAQAAATEPCGLDAITQFERLPFLKLDTLAAGQSSFDRTGGNGDFSNFLYTEGAEKVLLDLSGPGTVYRIWFTGFDRGGDYIKVYFDGESTPRINLLLRDLFAGKTAPFLSPLVGNDVVSSGGFYCYLPLPFHHGIKITSNATSGSFYYNIGYHTYSQDTAVVTWTGKEDSQEARNVWRHAGTNPESTAGQRVVSNTFDLAPGASNLLLDIAGPAEISSLKLSVPGTAPAPQPAFVTDDGRAFRGFSQFQMALTPANEGVTLVRRLDYAIGNQTADVYVDGRLVGQWSNRGSDASYQWRDSRFNIPASFTAHKNQITIKVAFVSSDVDWNEFYYWVYCSRKGATNLTDSLDVGKNTSEKIHDYVVDHPTWLGERSYAYQPKEIASNTANLLANLWLTIAFDGGTNASVFAPIGTFFAVGQFASYFTRALPVGMDRGTNFYCYFPMPFAERATVSLSSRCAQAVTNIQCEIQSKPFTNSFANVGYFKTDFRTESPTTNGQDILMLDTEGAGQLVGIVENMMGPLDRSYLEGDERFYVDDSQSPAFYGTGTEDFYNAGWYFNRGLFTRPMQGNPAHVIAGKYDETTAYRFFLQDAIPFRKHIRAGMEHGTGDSVSENTWTLAYYYLQPRARAVLADELNVGNTASETAHGYSITNQTWSGARNYSYDGNFDNVIITDDGRAHKGWSVFKLSLPSANTGAILRRRFDQGVFNQKANVYADNVLAGVWYKAGGNTSHRWRDDDFMLPASLTAGKTNIQIKIEFVSSGDDWNEFNYRLYALMP